MIINLNEFNNAANKLKDIGFSGDRKAAAQALSVSLFSQDYNVVSSVLKSQPKTSDGVMSKISPAQRRLLATNLKALSEQLEMADSVQENCEKNAKLMLSEIRNIPIQITKHDKGISPIKLLGEIFSTIDEISKGENVSRLQVWNVYNVIRDIDAYSREIEVSASLKTENFFIEWKDFPIIEEGTGRAYDFLRSPERSIFINGMHLVDWMASSKINTNIQDLLFSIAKCDVNSCNLSLSVSAELASILVKEMI